jgi:hypothetical protein
MKQQVLAMLATLFLISPNNATPVQRQTWAEFVAQGGRGDRFIQVDYDLPIQFRKGFVYFNLGADQITAFIIKQGLSSYPQRVEGLTEINDDVADQYIESGSAIAFNWNLGNSGQRYINDPSIKFPRQGTGCLRNTCLTALSFSNEEITQVLRSQKPFNNHRESR